MRNASAGKIRPPKNEYSKQIWNTASVVDSKGRVQSPKLLKGKKIRQCWQWLKMLALDFKSSLTSWLLGTYLGHGFCYQNLHLLLRGQGSSHMD